jgi:hypothetical protein
VSLALLFRANCQIILDCSKISAIQPELIVYLRFVLGVYTNVHEINVSQTIYKVTYVYENGFVLYLNASVSRQNK